MEAEANAKIEEKETKRKKEKEKYKAKIDEIKAQKDSLEKELADEKQKHNDDLASLALKADSSNDVVLKLTNEKSKTEEELREAKK